MTIDSKVELVARAIAREVIMSQALDVNTGHSGLELAAAIERAVERFWPQCVGQAIAAIEAIAKNK